MSNIITSGHSAFRSISANSSIASPTLIDTPDSTSSSRSSPSPELISQIPLVRPKPTCRPMNPSLNLEKATPFPVNDHLFPIRFNEAIRINSAWNSLNKAIQTVEARSEVLKQKYDLTNSRTGKLALKEQQRLTDQFRDKLKAEHTRVFSGTAPTKIMNNDQIN